MTDLYTKVVLTVIAGGIVFNAVRPLEMPVTAYAQATRSAPQPQHVIIDEIRSNSQMHVIIDEVSILASRPGSGFLPMRIVDGVGVGLTELPVRVARDDTLRQDRTNRNVRWEFGQSKCNIESMNAMGIQGWEFIQTVMPNIPANEQGVNPKIMEASCLTLYRVPFEGVQVRVQWR